VRPDGVPTEDVAAAWVAAHGLADLTLSRPMTGITALPPEERDAFYAAVIGRALPR
jgi:hypothetical protein